jgi:hypothetical protein
MVREPHHDKNQNSKITKSKILLGFPNVPFNAVVFGEASPPAPLRRRGEKELNRNKNLIINRNQKSLSFGEGFRVRPKKKRCEKRLGRKALLESYQEEMSPSST